jgi:hypothetical protein
MARKIVLCANEVNDTLQERCQLRMVFSTDNRAKDKNDPPDPIDCLLAYVRVERNNTPNQKRPAFGERSIRGHLRNARGSNSEGGTPTGSGSLVMTNVVETCPVGEEATEFQNDSWLLGVTSKVVGALPVAQSATDIGNVR